jgi:hypothetical protein
MLLAGSYGWISAGRRVPYYAVRINLSFQGCASLSSELGLLAHRCSLRRMGFMARHRRRNSLAMECVDMRKWFTLSIALTKATPLPTKIVIIEKGAPCMKVLSPSHRVTKLS